jgi:hypothetical protein
MLLLHELVLQQVLLLHDPNRKTTAATLSLY